MFFSTFSVRITQMAVELIKNSVQSLFSNCHRTYKKIYSIVRVDTSCVCPSSNMRYQKQQKISCAEKAGVRILHFHSTFSNATLLDLEFWNTCRVLWFAV